MLLGLLATVLATALAVPELNEEVHFGTCDDLVKTEEGREELVETKTEKHVEIWQAIVLMICFGAFALFVCLIHRIIRTYVFYDAHLLDTFFDGGGDINAGLVACAVVAKFTWSFTFTQSTNDTALWGVVGTFWFAAALACQLFLFSIVAAEIRIKAPGAKTYLQVIKGRHGTFAHVTLLTFALLLNVMVSGMVMMEGVHILTEVTDGVGEEVTSIVIAIVIAFFTVVGGVGGYIYVAYFTCALIMSIVLVYLTDMYQDPLAREDNEWGSHNDIFPYIECSQTDEDNKDFSALTFISLKGMFQGIVLVLSGFTHVFVDQSYWQAAISSKPGHGVWGFITAGIAWFAIPFATAFTFGMGYWVYSIQMDAPIATNEEMREGLIPVFVSRLLLGRTGDFIIFTLTMAALVTTAASQVLGASSIIVYDIYQTYIAPFRSTPVSDQTNVSPRMRRAILNEEYLEYDRRSMVLKHVVVVSLSVLLIPIALVFLAINVDTMWLFMFSAVLCGSCVIPIALAITWHRITGSGVAVGALVGFVAGFSAWLVVSSTYDDGLEMFRLNTGQYASMITGAATPLIVGGVVCIIVSMCCGGCDSGLMEEEEWEKCRKIDNPVFPWAVKYAPDIGPSLMIKGRPHFYTVRSTYKSSEICAYVVGVVLAVSAVLIWPAAMLTLGTWKDDFFWVWTLLVLIWTIVSAAYLILVPLIWEIYRVCRQAYYNRAWASSTHRERLEEDYSEPDEKIPPPTPTPPPQDPPAVTTVPVPDTTSLKSDSDMNSTLDDNMFNTDQKKKWRTMIALE